MKLIDNLKNFFVAHPVSDKAKHRMQGVAIGGALASVAFLVMAIAVGCSSTSESDTAKEPTNAVVRERLNVFDDTSSLANTEWELNADIYSPQFPPCGLDLNFTYVYDDALVSCNSIIFQYASSGGIGLDVDSGAIPPRNIYTGTFDVYYGHPDTNATTPVFSTGVGWYHDYFRTISVIDAPHGEDEPLAWLNGNGVLLSSNSSSSSSEASSEAVGFDVRLPERTAFSAWVKNPSNNASATNYDSNAPFVLYTGTSSGDNNTYISTAYTEYSVGEFYVDGNPSVTFDVIGITTQNLSVDNVFAVDGDDEASQVSEAMYERGAFVITRVAYKNSASGDVLPVLTQGMQDATLNGVRVTALTGTYWLADGYRNVRFVDGSLSISVNGYDAPVKWWVENNSLSSSTAISAFVLGNSSTGVFGLLASALGAVGSILGISLIPGLTLGTLMFIPLVVLVVFAIIKIMGK